jgi:hypothetical protein
MAPAALKGIALTSGWSSTTVDINVLACQAIAASEHATDLVRFFHEGRAATTVSQQLKNLFDSWADLILMTDPQVVGLSVFTYNCQVGAKFLALSLRKKKPEVKIIIGGSGLNHNALGGSRFGAELVRAGLVDHYIRGDGEHALYDYLQGQTTTAGLDNDDWKELTNQDLAQLPRPDYDDYDFDQYGIKFLPIYGSRGCVRNCTFCDVHGHWKKFTWRTAEHIFDEMIYNSQRYGIRHFKFQDSLINGNLKEYRRLMELIAQHNSQVPAAERLRWSSFFILRPWSQFGEKDWQLTALGGATILMVGIESFSEPARYHLGKKFDNSDIDRMLEMAQKYDFKTNLLFLTGYITETEKDIDFAEQWWRDHTQYKDVITASLGTPLGVLKGTPLDLDFDSLGLIRTGPNAEDWANPVTDNTPARRVEWHKRIHTVVSDLGYEMWTGADNHFILERMIKDTQ